MPLDFETLAKAQQFVAMCMYSARRLAQRPGRGHVQRRARLRRSEVGGKRLMSSEGARRVLYQQSTEPTWRYALAPVKFALGHALGMSGMDFAGHEVCFSGSRAARSSSSISTPA